MNIVVTQSNLKIENPILIGHSNGGRIIIKLLGNKELKHKYQVGKVVLIGTGMVGMSFA